MEPYNMIMGLALLLIGGISTYLIVIFDRKSDPRNRKHRSVDYNSIWLYTGAIGGMIGGLVAIIREFMKL